MIKKKRLQSIIKKVNNQKNQTINKLKQKEDKLFEELYANIDPIEMDLLIKTKKE
jgi:hypothetical protein